jgi:hypothetical protein
MSSPTLPRLSRRTALKVTAGTTLGPAVAAAAIASQKPAPLAAGAGGAATDVLTAVERAQLAALCETLCPGEPGRFPSASELNLTSLVEQRLGELEEDVRGQLKVGIAVFDNGLVYALAGEGVRPFTALSAEERARAVERWRFSGAGFRRTLYKGLASLVQSIYWSQPETQLAAGYPDPPASSQLRRTYAENLVDYRGLRASAKATET